MLGDPISLQDFIAESNRIERIFGYTEIDMEATKTFLEPKPELEVEHLEAYVLKIAGQRIREHEGMDVQVGTYLPPPGGVGIVHVLQELLHEVNELPPTWQKGLAYKTHRRYESLHPFMDGNGRSGRVLWLYMMGGVENVPLGFLHTYYYQSLDDK